MPDSPPTPKPAPFSIRPIEPRDLTWVRAELVRNWHSTRISSLGVWHDADRLPGFIAERQVERVGLLTHTPLQTAAGQRPRGCEVITLSTAIDGAGIGTALLEAAVSAASTAGCERLFLTTTNDNLRAIAFYQKRGWRLVAVHPGAMDRARLIEPTIPLVGLHGIPLHDELEFERQL